jgi:lysophospholipase L1-like esterase
MNQALNQPFKLNDTIVFEGDSTINRRCSAGLTNWPFLRLSNWDRSWCDILAELLFCWQAPLNLSFHNVGIGGSTSKQVLDRFNEHVAPYKPNWLFVTVCSNDIAKQITIEQTQQYVHEYVTLAKETCNANVVYVGGYLVYPNCLENKAQMQPQKVARYQAIESAAMQAGGHYLDIGKLIKTQADALHAQYDEHSMYTGQDGHFSHMGNMVIAGAMLRAMGYLNASV